MSPSDPERGAVLFILVLSVVVLSAAGMALHRSRMDHLGRETRRERATTAAFWAAEGGLERARVALRDDPAWEGGTVRVGEGRAVIEVSVDPDGAPDRRRVHVRGYHPSGRRPGEEIRVVVRATVRPGDGLPTVVRWRRE